MWWHRETTGRVELGFTDREGGVSQGPFGSLNLGSSTGDDPAAVLRNHQLVADDLGVPGLHAMSQVHGVEVVHADVLRADGSGTVPECDAVVTDRPGLALLVRVADCVPIVLADTDAGVIGAVHAGRVGLVAGVVPAAVEAMAAHGATAITAWIGPRAGACCYEVPEAMAADVEQAVPGTRSTTTWGTDSVDLGRGVVGQLHDLGVRTHDLGVDTCTIEHESLFSHRRQGAASGRLGGVVVLR